MSGNALDPILEAKREHLARARSARPESELAHQARAAPLPRGFARALELQGHDGWALICEIKKASPSRGLIRPDFDPAALARAYKAGGATCLSVLTDTPFFQGADEHLRVVRNAVDLPILRKDFTIDPWQALEARLLGADCILIILAAVELARAREIEAAAMELGLDCLLEVHDAEELDDALSLSSRLIGINNRNLKTLQVDLQTTIDLAARVPADRMLVCESGLRSGEDLARAHQAGARAFLIGESLLVHHDVQAATHELIAAAGGAP